MIRENEPLTPGTAEHNAYERVYSVYESLYPALKGAYGELAQL